MKTEEEKAFAQGVVWAAGFLNTGLGNCADAKHILAEAGYDTRSKLRSLGIAPEDISKVSKPLQQLKNKNQ